MGHDDRRQGEYTAAQQAAAAESEDRFRTIFQHSNDAIFLLDPERDRIVDANPRACRFLGYERDELLALRMSDVHPHELERLQEFTGAVLAQGEGWTDELSCLGKDGVPVPSEISASLVSVEGEGRVIALVRDVSRRQEERRLLEATVERRTAALRRSEARLRTLLAVNNAIVSRLDPESLFPAIAGALEQVVELDRLALLLYDPERDVLTVASLAGDETLRSTVPTGSEMRPAETLLEPVVRDRRRRSAATSWKPWSAPAGRSAAPAASPSCWTSSHHPRVPHEQARHPAPLQLRRQLSPEIDELL